MHNFRLAPMCPVIRSVTAGLLALPPVFLLSAVFVHKHLAIPALLMAACYLWVWLRFRPTRFVVHPAAIEIVWPLKRRELARDSISDVRIMDRGELRKEIGWGMRVGAGGLWGGFGWLWTGRSGIVQMYISRMDRFVWIGRGHERSWLISPEKPEDFVRLLKSDRRSSAQPVT